jgi:hypothetical protein
MTTASAVTAVVWLVIYFIPTVVAHGRAHQTIAGIFMCNLLFGWTLVGWGIALIWALSKPPVIILRRT